MRLSWLSLCALILLLARPAVSQETAATLPATSPATASSTLPAAPPLPSPVEAGDAIDLDELRLMLRPLTAEELEPVVENWTQRLEAKMQAISAVRLAARRSEGSARTDFVQQAAELALDRDRLADRVEVVLDAYEGKGGDASMQRQYLGAVTRADIDTADVGELAAKLQAWLFDLDGGITVVMNIIWFILILIAAFILAKVLQNITRRALGRVGRASRLLKDFLAGLVSKIVILVGFVVAISFLGVNIGPLMAAIGAAGLVVGLALQGTLSNFASGILILLYRPYDVGDVINAAGVSGKVEAMTLVSTTVLTFDNQKIVVPNNNIWGDVITNVTGRLTRRVDLTFGVAYHDDVDRVQAVLEDVVQSHPLTLAEPEPLIKLHELGDSSVNFIVRPWANTADYWTVYWDLTKAVKKRFDAEGISIPFPQRDVHLYRTDAA